MQLREINRVSFDRRTRPPVESGSHLRSRLPTHTGHDSRVGIQRQTPPSPRTSPSGSQHTRSARLSPPAQVLYRFPHLFHHAFLPYTAVRMSLNPVHPRYFWQPHCWPVSFGKTAKQRNIPRTGQLTGRTSIEGVRHGRHRSSSKSHPCSGCAFEDVPFAPFTRSITTE